MLTQHETKWFKNAKKRSGQADKSLKIKRFHYWHNFCIVNKRE